MAVVQEVTEGRCTVRVHDDAYINRTPEEVAETIMRCSEIVHQYVRSKGASDNASA